MWEMILAGRYMMIPISLASLIGLTVIIERALVLRQLRINVERGGLTVEFTNVPSHAHRVLREILDWEPS